MARDRQPISRDTALILLAGICVVATIAAVVALVLAGQVDSTTAIASLSGPGAVGGTAVGRLSGANQPVSQQTHQSTPTEGTTF